MGKSRVHSVQLTELAPDTQYFYQVKSDERKAMYTTCGLPALRVRETVPLAGHVEVMQRDSEYPRKFDVMINKGIIPYVTESEL